MKGLKQLWNNATEYKIALFAFMAWLLFEVGGKYLGWTTYPVGYWQKVAFAIVSIIIISSVAWAWLAKTFPALKRELDPDKLTINHLTKWQVLVLASWLFSLFVFCAVLLASLY